MTRGKAWVIAAALLCLAGCVPVQSGPAVSPNFTFAPPSSGSPTRQNMAIGILHPAGQANGKFFITDSAVTSSGKAVIDEMLDATQSDIERIIIAKGFTTAGAYPTIDEMTFGQKQRATLILRPVFTVNLAVNRVPFGQSTATVSGYAVLEMLEPLSREKVWVKRLELTPITKQVRTTIGDLGGRPVVVVETNSMTELLNTFYQPTMKKMWEQLDSSELAGLKRDADKLKSTTQYKGG